MAGGDRGEETIHIDMGDDGVRKVFADVREIRAELSQHRGDRGW